MASIRLTPETSLRNAETNPWQLTDWASTFLSMPNWQEQRGNKMSMMSKLHLELTQLGYADDQIAEMSVEEAVKIAGWQ